MFDLLSKEKIYGIDAVSSCFVIDIEIRDFINSVRAEIFDCVEFDIAFKVLLQLCALIALRCRNRIPPSSIARSERSIQVKPHTFADVNAVCLYRFHIELKVIG